MVQTISLDHCDEVFVHENTIGNDQPNSSTNLRGLNIVTSTGGNICNNGIDMMGYSMFFDDDCQNSVLKLNLMQHYSSAIYFNNAEFTDQGIASTETWDNTFQNGSANYRLDGSLTNTSFILWYYDSNDPDMYVNGGYNNVANNKIFASGCSNCTAPTCDPLPALRQLDIRETMDSVSDEFTIYPNPTDAVLLVQQNGENYLVQYNVIDATGRCLLTTESALPVAKLDVAFLADGIYFLLITKDGETSAKQFVIHH